MQAHQIPTLFIGPPGVGKTALPMAEAREKNMTLVYLPLAERDPLEVSGAMYIDNDENGALARWAPSEAWETACQQKCMVILDELTAASRPQRVAALRYADDSARSQLHPETQVVATCNPPEYAAGAGDPLTGPELTRFRIKRVGPERAVAWMLKQGGEVARVGAYLTANHLAAIASPEEINAAIDKQEPFATPRTWTRAAQSALPTEEWHELIGPAAVVGWVTWQKRQDLPDPATIISGDCKVVPERGDAVLATSAAVCALIKPTSSEVAVNNVINWLSLACKKGHVGVVSRAAYTLGEVEEHHKLYREAMRDGRFKDLMTVLQLAAGADVKTAKS